MQYIKNNGYHKRQSVRIIAVAASALAVGLMAFVCLMVGSSHMTPGECIDALLQKGTDAGVKIIYNIRMPRVLAAIIAGAGLSVSGLIMQTTLKNEMASPSTLGVSNAAVFGANLSIIAFSGGIMLGGNSHASCNGGANPYATSFTAFVFAVLSVLLILGLCRIKAFSPSVVVLAGIAVGSVWTAGTTILQYYANDVGLSASVIWSFGDLGRATYETDLIMLAVILPCCAFFLLMSWKYNALLSGDAVAEASGVNVKRLRLISLLLASVITAVFVSFLGMIGFIGIICPHVVKKLFGQDHRFTIPLSVTSGSFLLLAADTVSRSLGNGSTLPVGAITTLLGAPFFLTIIISKRGHEDA